jgi:hypothetical protein
MPIADFIKNANGEPYFCFEGSGQKFLEYAQENLQDFYDADLLDLSNCDMVEFSNLIFDDEDFQQLGHYLGSKEIIEIIFNHNCTFQTQNFHNFLDLATLDKEEMFLSFADARDLSQNQQFITSANQLREAFLFALNNPEKKLALSEESRFINISNLHSFIKNVLEMISQSFEINADALVFLQNDALFSQFFPDHSIIDIECTEDEEVGEEAAEFVVRIIERERVKDTPCATISRKHYREDRDDGNGEGEDWKRLKVRQVRQNVR